MTLDVDLYNINRETQADEDAKAAGRQTATSSLFDIAGYNDDVTKQAAIDIEVYFNLIGSTQTEVDHLKPMMDNQVWLKICCFINTRKLIAFRSTFLIHTIVARISTSQTCIAIML